MRQGQETLKGATQLIGWHDERHSCERIVCLQDLKIVNQCRFEGGMERPGDKTKHGDRESLLLNRQAKDRHDHVMSPVRASREMGTNETMR